MITDYASLQAAAANWLDRQDLANNIPDFIFLNEAMMNRTLRLREMETRVTVTINPGDEFLTLPSDFLQEQSVRLSDGNCNWELDPQPDGVIEAQQPFIGRPEHYSLVNGQMHFWPIATASYTATLVYWAQIPSLSNTNTTNWLLAKAPDAYLYGTLLQAMPFLDDETNTGTAFTNLYTQAITSLKAANKTRVGRLQSPHPSAMGRCYDSRWR